MARQQSRSSRRRAGAGSRAKPRSAGLQEADTGDPASEPSWRQRAISRSLSAAQSRARERVQRFLDAAFELIDEKGTTDFTIQEVIERSKQSLRGFYQYFRGKDELLLALFEETIRKCAEDIRKAVAAESDPTERLRAFVLRLHRWCGPAETSPARDTHDLSPISEFSLQLLVSHDPERVISVMEPIWTLLLELVEDAVSARVIDVADPRRAAALIQQTVMFCWLGSRLIHDPQVTVTAEEVWDFCLRGLRARS